MSPQYRTRFPSDGARRDATRAVQAPRQDINEGISVPSASGDWRSCRCGLNRRAVQPGPTFGKSILDQQPAALADSRRPISLISLRSSVRQNRTDRDPPQAAVRERRYSPSERTPRPQCVARTFWFWIAVVRGLWDQGPISQTRDRGEPLMTAPLFGAVDFSCASIPRWRLHGPKRHDMRKDCRWQRLRLARHRPRLHTADLR
jgi:hypothetical protein